MSAPNRFMLSNEQRERLLSARAAWEEGEDEERLERLRQQEEDAETLRVIARLLAETGFAEGSDLTRAQMARLLTLVRALAPNPNLDARLLRRPGEPIDLNRDLRDLLYSPASFPLRLRAFLTRRHAGGQTALQFLCAVFPQEWPLVTRAGLRALDLSSEQHEAAIQEARERFDLPEPAAPPPIGESGAGGEGAPAVAGIPATDPILRLLADVVAYTAVREALTAADYLEVHRLLTQGLTTRRGRSRRTLAVALYAPSSASAAAVTMVRELETPEYESAPAAQDMET